MPKSYSKASREVHEQMQRVMEEHHSELVEAGVRIAVDLVTAARNDAGESIGPAIMEGGYPAIACVRKTSAKQRTRIPFDAIVEVDADWLETAPNDQVDAMFDHELQHLEVVRDESGSIATTDDLRPKLKLRKHDIVVGGFMAVVKRRPHVALEYQQVKAIWDEHGQGLFDFVPQKQLA